MAAGHLVTADELERMGREDLELVRGVLVPVMTPAGEQHGALAAFLTVELGAFVRSRGLGRVYVEVGYRLFTNPDTVRGPDVSFVSRQRAATQPRRKGFIHGIPDLAVEIASMDKTMAEIAVQAGEYLEAGTLLVWVVDPESREVHVYRPGVPTLVLSANDTLDGGEVIPGFTLKLARLFAELD
ncbi:MAG TPA: Uma2 family endonuclease [Gemmatimonadales bacterium]|nr:Uma2 family endonuclease [Gemmatimonadales bacterium]